MTDTAGTPLATLGLRPRPHNALRHAGVRTVEAVLGLPLARIGALRGVGAQGLREALAARAAWAAHHPGCPSPATDEEIAEKARGPQPQDLAALIARWLRYLNPGHDAVVMTWLGLWAPPPERFKDIAARHGVSCHQACHIVHAALRELKRGPLAFCLAPYHQGIMRLVEALGGLASAAELHARLPAEVPLGGLDPVVAARLFGALGEGLVWLPREDALALATSPVRWIGAIRRELGEIVRAAPAPLAAEEVLARYTRAHPEGIDGEFVAACLRTHPSIEVTGGGVRPVRRAAHETRDAIVVALRANGGPASASRILVQVHAQGGRVDWRAIRQHLSRYRGELFVRAAAGLYALAEWESQGQEETHMGRTGA